MKMLLPVAFCRCVGCSVGMRAPHFCVQTVIFYCALCIVEKWRAVVANMTPASKHIKSFVFLGEMVRNGDGNMFPAQM